MDNENATGDDSTQDDSQNYDQTTIEPKIMELTDIDDINDLETKDEDNNEIDLETKEEKRDGINLETEEENNEQISNKELTEISVRDNEEEIAKEVIDNLDYEEKILKNVEKEQETVDSEKTNVDEFDDKLKASEITEVNEAEEVDINNIGDEEPHIRQINENAEDIQRDDDAEDAKTKEKSKTEFTDDKEKNDDDNKEVLNPTDVVENDTEQKKDDINEMEDENISKMENLSSRQGDLRNGIIAQDEEDLLNDKEYDGEELGSFVNYDKMNSNSEQNFSNDGNLSADDINNNTSIIKVKAKNPRILTTDLIELEHLPQSYLNRAPVSALTPVYSFGYNRYVPIINLSTQKRSFIFYSASHLAIVYDYFHNEQMILQGHSNSITCTTASKDKRWLGTGDKGEGSVVIIWDCNTGLPVRTMFEPHPNGVVAIELTPDARYLATISAENTQTFAIWDWTTGEDIPLCSAALSPDYGVQRYLNFSQDDIFHVTTNSESRVLFYQWDKVGNIKYFAPTLTDKDFNKPVGRFSNTVYLPKTTKAITATSQGLLVVWEGNSPLVKVSNESTPDKRAVKLVPVHQKGINVLTLIDEFIVTGDVGGEIKFFDFNFMLIFWYQDWNFGAITSISPSNNLVVDKLKQSLANSEYPDEATIEKNKFYLRDFIVGTITTIFATVKVEGSKIKVIFREHDQSVFSVAAHPSMPLVATGSYSGLLKIWDYEQKRSLKTRLFDKVPIRCLSFDHRGIQLAVGFTNGEVRILDTHALKDVTKTSFHFSKVHITHISFSERSEFLATVDANCTTTVYRPGQGEHEDGWVYLARYRAHYKPVVEMLFGRFFDTDVPRLFTLGQDRRLVEYDLGNATEDNLPIAHELRIEQRSIPLTMCWYPELEKEGFLVTANDEYKLKMYNHQTKMCRYTYLGPTFGSPVKILRKLPLGSEHPTRADGFKQRYVAYANSNKIGLMRLDFDGNPYNYMTMIAHPKGVTNLCCSFDGNYLISVGEDFIVTVWHINPEILETQARLGGSDMAPYYELIEGGEFGMFMHELKDYFYYSMIRTQGIDSLQTRKVDVVIEIGEVPYIMRGIGFYPSEEEIENMLNELKFRPFYSTGECATTVNLDTFLKLYINHRPAFGIHSSKIDEAFRYILKENSDDLTSEKFLDLLINRGEHILEDDLAEYLATLLGLNQLGGSLEMEDFDPHKVMGAVNSFLPDVVTPQNFIEDMLCMKIVDKESLLTTKVDRANKAANGTQT